jgi:hypothetical protein
MELRVKDLNFWKELTCDGYKTLFETKEKALSFCFQMELLDKHQTCICGKKWKFKGILVKKLA